MTQYDHSALIHNVDQYLCRRKQWKSITSTSTLGRQQYTVKVNHVPLSVSKQQLKALFDLHGSCEVHLKHQYGQNEQHAFINYKSHEAALAATKRLNGSVLSDGTITVKLSEGSSCSVGSGADICTVKVENLSKKVTEETLEEVFGFFGETEVVNIKINTPDKSAFNYAYVNYANVHDAQKAVKELNGSKILGSNVRVKLQNSGKLDIQPSTPFPLIVDTQLSRIPGAMSPLPPTSHLPYYGRYISIPPPPPPPYDYPVFPSQPWPRPVIQPTSGGFAMLPPRPPPPGQYCGGYVPVRTVAPPHAPAELGVLPHPPYSVSSKPLLSNTIKVSIHGHLTAEDLETIFDQFGTITAKPVIISGTPDFAYINYESPDQAQVASMSMRQQKFKGVLIDVKVKKDKRSPNSLMTPTSSHDYQKVDCEPLIVQVITSPDLPEFKLQLQGIESSTSVRVIPMKSGNGFNISGSQEKLEGAQSLLKVVISKAQEKIAEEPFTLSCLYIPLFINQETLRQIAKIEQKHRVEFHAFNNSTQQPTKISMLSKLVSTKFVSSVNSPATVECVSGYLCTCVPTTKDVQSPEDDIWEWQDDDGKFKPYGPDQCKEFSLNFHRDPTSIFTCVITTKFGQTEYTINLKTMTQTNNSTGRGRKVQHKCVRGSCAMWYYTDNKRELVPYTNEQSCEIERTWMSGNKTLSMIINHKRYQLNLIQMKQTNTVTLRERKISRMSSQSSTHLLSFQVRGLKENLRQAVQDFKEELQAGVIKTSITLPSDSEGTLHSSLCELTKDYFISVCIFDDVIHIEGVQGYIDKVAIKIREEKLLFESKSLIAQRIISAASSSQSVLLPEYWEPQTEEIVLKGVPNGSKEWTYVETLVHATLPSVRIRTLERIQNKWLWDKYNFSKERLRQQNNGVINERELFHGTGTTPPEKIYKSRQGFDFRFCSTHNLWGAGSYFAVSAKYSDAKYAYRLFGQGAKQLILAKVLTGEAYPSLTPEPTLTKPPVNKKKQSVMATSSKSSAAFIDELYDSVCGYTNGSDIYVIYDHDKAYPDYLITYVTA